ncbi:MAG: 50S ribosomal protein L21 [Candidatus Cloacimonetes bacterium]|nr:50S ribosomal protein L21 [Candidatus Cloacimonadota bacterium]MBL7086694.1 50S ribosomal protein L21 [Candidatus Cloacimonadota bacterium]
MYAIIDFKGQQFKVQKNDVLKIPYFDGQEIGAEFDINEILILGGDKRAKIGKPYVKKAKVLAEILSHGKDKKIIVFKKKRRKGYSRKQGHRQQYTEIKIKDIIQGE